MKIITYVHKGRVKNITLDELKMMKVSLTKTWEDLCTRCGKCCFEKSVQNGVRVIDYTKPCQFLKYIGRKAECSIYPDRFNKYERCNTVPEAIQKGNLPSSCPYIRGDQNYRAPHDNGKMYKWARKKLSRYDEDYSPVAGTPTGGTMNLPAEPPANPTREDLGKPSDWKRRREELRRRKKENRLLAEGKAGISDPRQKTEYDIKPSGHGLGG